MPDFAPTASWNHLQQRAKLLARLRAFFADRGFLEVETPLLSHDVVVDRHLEPIAVRLPDAPPSETLWLQTSPEFAMKRMLAAGATAIYQVTHAFRADERGPYHNPEFTMAEWYRVGDGLVAGMQLLSDLAETLLTRGPAERLTYGDAFRRHLAIDPHGAALAELRTAGESRGAVGPASLGDDRDGWLDWLLVEFVQPHLGTGRPTILFDYPASQAALARVRPGPPEVAERFELFVDGIELANGYHELLDPAVLRARNVANNAARAAEGRVRLPEESRLLTAMEHGLPACAGTALGFDRLVMVALGARRIDEVVAFPFERA